MSDNVTWHYGDVTRVERSMTRPSKGITVWMTGLSGSGKSTIARSLEKALVTQGRSCYVLDGDNVRHGLNSDLGFSAEDRAENVRRLGEVARLMSDAGLVAVVPVISPYRRDRERVRQLHADADLSFLEVHVDTPLEVCEARDPKGLYAMARSGSLKGMTGVDDPYEPPIEPEVRIDGGKVNVDEATVQLLNVLGQEPLT